MRNYIILLVMAILPSCFLSSCDDPSAPEELYFFGDSLVARWDLQESFPTFITHNDGVSGSGITYLKSAAGTYMGKDVVVLIGTNNINSVTDEIMKWFGKSYLQAVADLNADHVYLISIPPRSAKGDNEDVNETIQKFNALVSDLCMDYPSITYVDVYDALSYKGTINREYTLDGVHLNVYGYNVVTKLLLEKL